MTLLIDPAADKRDELMAASGVPELDDKIWFHKTASAVIEAGRCVNCGGCIAACPSQSISIAEDGKPTLTKMCTGCSACWDYCPEAGFRVEKLQKMWNGGTEVDAPVLASYSAVTTTPNGGQDGGFVTALLEGLLASGEIDAAIVTQKLDAFRGETSYATTPEELRAAAGSVYHQTEPLSVLNKKPPKGAKRLAYVGTPCQITVLRALQNYPWQWRDSQAPKVVLTVALFCTRSFDPINLMRVMLERGEDISKFERFDIREGKLHARMKDGERRELGPIKEFHSASLGGCDECSDFTGNMADIGVGNVGSEPGVSTVLIRTETGERFWTKAAEQGTFSHEPLEDLSAVWRLRDMNMKRAMKSLEREYDPDGDLWIPYTEHLENYEDTERHAEAVPPHRSHHYEVAC